jgi:hypothetical protein
MLHLGSQRRRGKVKARAVHLPWWRPAVRHAQVRRAANRGTHGGILNSASHDLDSDTTDLDKASLDVDLTVPDLHTALLVLQLRSTMASFRGKMGSRRRWA